MIIFAHILNIFGLNNISDSGAGGFRTLPVNCSLPIIYEFKNPEVKHRSNIGVMDFDYAPLPVKERGY